jgi:ethanolamine utilization protein EutA (predicted chaperonin)
MTNDQVVKLREKTISAAAVMLEKRKFNIENLPPAKHFKSDELFDFRAPLDEAAREAQLKDFKDLNDLSRSSEVLLA